MHFNSLRTFGTILVIGGIFVLFAAISTVAARITRPSVPTRPNGLAALELAENRRFEQFLERYRTRRLSDEIDTEQPVDPDAPNPESTRLYNNLLDNLFNSLHYFYRVAPETDSSRFVTSWDADTGDRVLGDVRLLALEYNTAYLLSLELYRRMHSKAVFDEDLEFARDRVRQSFEEDWHTIMEWPLGLYFDLVELWELTGDHQYIEWAERYAAGDGPNDYNTPLSKAKDLALRYQLESPRTASPFYFLHAALLADYGSRNDDPAGIDQARSLFEGLRELLYDPRFKMLYKQASISAHGSSTRNVIQTFDTLEQLTAVRAILLYGRASGDPEALSLAEVLLDGVWGTESPLLLPPPEHIPPGAYYGLYTAYDYGREAVRNVPTEHTIVQILLFETIVMLNETTLGEYRGDVDFMVGWLEDLGPLYRENANGYLTSYEGIWEEPEQRLVSAKAAIWMARALVEDEWHMYRRARALTPGILPDD